MLRRVAAARPADSRSFSFIALSSSFASAGHARPLVVAILGPTATGKSALGARAGRARRRRDHQLRFDRRLSRLRHRHRQGAARRAARHPASPDRHRRADRGVHGGAVRARRGRGDPRHSRARAAADPRRRHRLLLPRADARPVSRARAATRRCARGSRRSPSAAASTFLHRMLQRVDPRVGRAHSAARPEADRPRARSVLPDRPAADRRTSPTRRRRCRTSTCSRSRLRLPAAADRRSA